MQLAVPQHLGAPQPNQMLPSEVNEGQLNLRSMCKRNSAGQHHRTFLHEGDVKVGYMLHFGRGAVCVLHFLLAPVAVSRSTWACRSSDTFSAVLSPACK